MPSKDDGDAATRRHRLVMGYQEQQLVQQQLPPPHVVEAPGATVTVRPPVAVVPTWPEKLSMANTPSW
ncbi:hypothetical protein [Catelliglobosispora koreensis]|uniref:hypothetical protein n=1 Tax=Catelliglobosispora koreensis TaxID=129052 RepID=UPI0003694E99|nr:hypothetical protein [Catelliglobosispora koreensis]